MYVIGLLYIIQVFTNRLDKNICDMVIKFVNETILGGFFFFKNQDVEMTDRRKN